MTEVMQNTTTDTQWSRNNKGQIVFSAVSIWFSILVRIVTLFSVTVFGKSRSKVHQPSSCYQDKIQLNLIKILFFRDLYHALGSS